MTARAKKPNGDANTPMSPQGEEAPARTEVNHIQAT
jgi:hypothetical protein